VIAEIFLLAVASMFWPFLLVVDIVALRTSRPVPILAWFLAGGFLTTIGLGLAIVYALRSSSLVSGSWKSTTDASVDLVVGCFALVAAALVWRGRTREPEPQPAQKSGRIERLVARGAALAFVAGIVANVVPGVFPFIALKDIAELNASVAATVALVVGFYIVMFTFVEAPLFAFLLAPERTKVAVESFNLWLGRHGRALAASVLLAVGVLAIVHGIVAAAR
jgi:hypothetical protein